MVSENSKHLGPGPHPSGSPQSVHGGGGTGDTQSPSALRSPLGEAESEGRAAGWQIVDRYKSAFYTNHVTGENPRDVGAPGGPGHLYGLPAARLHARSVAGKVQWFVQLGRTAKNQFVPDETHPVKLALTQGAVNELLSYYIERTKALPDEPAPGDYRLPDPGFYVLHQGGQWSNKHLGPGPHPGTGTPQEIHAGGDVATLVSAAQEHSALDHVNEEWSAPGAILDQWATAVGIDKPAIIEKFSKELEAWRAEDQSSYEETRHWYDKAHDAAQQLANKYNVPIETVAAVVSLTSAESVWENQNKASADDLIAVFLKENPTVTLKRAFVEKYVANLAGRQENPIDRSELLKLFPEGANEVHLPLSDVPSEICYQLPIWEQRMNAKTLTLPSFWRSSIGTVARVLRHEDPWIVTQGVKQRSFMYNILHPDDPDAVTIDRWMLRAAMNDARVGKSNRQKLPDGSWTPPKPIQWTDGHGQEHTIDGLKLSKIAMSGSYAKIYNGPGRVETNPSKTGKPVNLAGAYLWHADWVEKVAKRVGVVPDQAQALIWTLVRNRKPGLLRYVSQFSLNRSQAEHEIVDEADEGE